MLWDPTVCLVRATKAYFVKLYPYRSIWRLQVHMAPGSHGRTSPHGLEGSCQVLFKCASTESHWFRSALIIFLVRRKNNMKHKLLHL